MAASDSSEQTGKQAAPEAASLLDSLVSVMQKEVEIYRELLSIIDEESGVLRKPQLSLLTESNAKKETCLLKARMLEEVRANIVKKIARFLEVEERDINLTFLSACAGGRRAEELRVLQQTLSPLVKSINEANEKNRDLLSYSLSYVRNSLDFINNLLSSGAGYLKTGKLKAADRNGRLLNKEG